MTLILGIETSCDETAAAVVENGTHILSNVVASQVEIHSQYGGVFPEVASRMHVEAIQPVVEQAMADANVSPMQIDAIAVTHGPGLAGSLLVGVNFAKGLALGWNKPLLGINHIEGHIYSLWVSEDQTPILFPVLVLVVSGGHTELVLMTDHGKYLLLGSTRDDAAGEAFDKVGRMLGLPYPGGPNIEKAAKRGNAHAYQFTRPMQEEGYDFSFSGLKTAVMRAVQNPPAGGKRTRGMETMEPGRLKPEVNVDDAAASFQRAAVEMLIDKTVKAAQAYSVKEILLAGGVSANSRLRDELRHHAALPVRYPPLKLCTDNAAMIAAAGYFRVLSDPDSQRTQDWLALDVLPMLPLAPESAAPPAARSPE
ncbi:MAG: tRNA (adenosine(37)-N6)-threonylcarbamoyltransferase complex transferase subunit TsaD [Anaerolineae bacterium]|nr:tRNA (adenosine(37)-N6)-threonylcarbamoyltransferase complex transferase subunit TsaD [Anaerolineae bacterium]